MNVLLWLALSCARREPSVADACPDHPERGGAVEAVHQGGGPLFARSDIYEDAVDVAALRDGVVAVGFETAGPGGHTHGWVTRFDGAGEPVWTGTISVGDGEDRATAVAVDGDDVWVGADVEIAAHDRMRAYLARWRGGAPAWTWVGAGNSSIRALAPKSGGVVAGGTLRGPLDVAGVPVAPAGDLAAFVAPFDGDRPRWVRLIESDEQVSVAAVAGLDDGLVAAGSFHAQARFGAVELTTEHRNGAGWAARWDRDGNVLWAKKLGGPKLSLGSIAVLADGTLAFGGGIASVDGEVVVGAGDPGEMRHTSQGHDALVVWTDADGRVLGVHTLASPVNDTLGDVEALGCDVVIAGQTWPVPQEQGAPGDAFVARLDRTGREIWRCAARSEGLSDRAYPMQHVAHAVSVGPDAVWATGTMRGTAVFGCETPFATLSTSSSAAEDWWVARFRP